MTPGERMMARVREGRQTKGQSRGPGRQTAAGPAGDAGYVIEEDHDGVRLRADFHDIDKFSLQLRSFEAALSNPPQPAHFNLERLRRQVDAIKRRVSYLLENFDLIEFDEHNGVAQLRSAPPAHEERTISFYEIFLRGNHALSICRYEVSGTPALRKVVPVGITQEAFERLANDFVAVLFLA